jgi:hypothetical protein
VEEEKEEEEDEVAAPEKPKAPSSWANLVASGGGIGKGSKGGRKGSPKPSRNGTADKSTSSVKPDLSSSKAPPQSRPTNGSKAVSNTSTSSTSSTSEINYQSKPSERTAEATLFIRNIPDKTKEPEIRALFEKQAAANGNKILGITLNPNRGFCFVDFDGPVTGISIMTPCSTTHSREMSQRMLFPDYNMISSTSMQITAPGDPSILLQGHHMLFLLNGDTPSVASWIYLTTKKL